MKKLMRFLKDEEGVAGIEYGLIVALIAALITIVAKKLEKRPGGWSKITKRRLGVVSRGCGAGKCTSAG